MNLRAGPGTDYKVVGYAYQGDQLPIYGRNKDGSWLQLDFVGKRWIASNIVEYSDDIIELPENQKFMQPQNLKGL